MDRNTQDVVQRPHHAEELLQIQPLVGRTLDGPVVEVESVYVDDGAGFGRHKKKRAVI